MSGSHLAQTLPASESSHITQVIAQEGFLVDEDPMIAIGVHFLNYTVLRN